MKFKKSLIALQCSFLISFSTSSFAQANQESSSYLIPRYGNNPNLAHVLAYKAQEMIVNTAKSIGGYSQKTFNKINPNTESSTALAQQNNLTDSPSTIPAITPVLALENTALQHSISQSTEQISQVTQPILENTQQNIYNNEKITTETQNTITNTQIEAVPVIATQQLNSTQTQANIYYPPNSKQVIISGYPKQILSNQ